MPSLNSSQRASLCKFSFADGRRCRSLRVSSSPDFCHYHAQKEARARAVRKLSEDLSFIFSGDFLSANDLACSLGRLIPAVLRGDVKPRTARTIAYLTQTLAQTIRLSKHEYVNAFSSDGWRSAVRSSVHANHNRLFPSHSAPAQEPEPAPPAPAPLSAPPGSAEARALDIARSLFPQRRPAANPAARAASSPSDQPSPSPSVPPPSPDAASAPPLSRPVQPPTRPRSGPPGIEGNLDPHASQLGSSTTFRVDGKPI